MAIFPIRNVGDGGLVPDRSPYDLPLNSWSGGQNIRFDGGSVSRYSVFKDAYPSINLDDSEAEVPVGISTFSPSPGEVRVLVVTRSSTVTDLGSTATDVTPSGDFSENNARLTSTYLGGMTVLNRSAEVPFYRFPGDDDFDLLPNWDSDDRAASIRSFKDYLVALNITRDSTLYPTMVKWSDTMQYGTPPGWDPLDPGTNAGENVLNDAQTPLVDACELGNSLILYTSSEVYRMDYIEGAQLFEWDKIFTDDGTISQNCVVEVGGLHYVFGFSDIYVHDGVMRKSITEAEVDNVVTSTVKRALYEKIDFSKRHLCFVAHDADRSEILFCFPSTDNMPWPATWGCNAAWVYNYVNESWTYIALPDVVGAVSISSNDSLVWTNFPTWDEAPQWNLMTGKGSETLALLSAGQVETVEPKVLILDTLAKGRSNKPVVQSLLFDAFVERRGLDMDEVGAKLPGRKLLRKIMPQVSTPGPAHVFRVQLGQHAYGDGDITWGPVRPFNPRTQYKLDSRVNGRYLAFRFIFPPGSTGELSGYDLDLTQIAGR